MMKNHMFSLSHCSIFLLLLLLSLLNGCSGRIDEAISYFSVQTPRPFAYVIGDEIQQKIDIEVRRGLELQYSSLPAKGRLNHWLELKNIKVRQTEGKKGIRYRISLRYQVFYAPLEVKMLTLPGFKLQFRQGVNVVEKQVPDWHFTIAPIRELSIRKQDGQEYMRPDAPAPLHDTGGEMKLLLGGLFAAVIAGAYLAWAHGYLGRYFRRNIFNRAMKQMSRVDNSEPGRLFKIMHDALNRLNGEVLFKHQLNDFYRRHESYRQLNSELEWFFELSNRFYFSGEQTLDTQQLHRIRRLCRQCSRIERGAQ